MTTNASHDYRPHLRKAEKVYFNTKSLCGERVRAEKICEDKREKIHGENMKKMRQYSPCNLVSLDTALLLFRPNKYLCSSCSV